MPTASPTASAGSPSWWPRALSTKQIAGRLHVSSYTVQDHLKSIFAKSGTASRGDLIAQLFLEHYAASLTSGVAAHT
jgi:hypothetical protein